LDIWMHASMIGYMDGCKHDWIYG